MILTTPAASQKRAFSLAGILNRLSLSESHTNPVISGQLKKTLRVTLGYSQISRNSLMAFDCAETEELKCIPDMQETKHGNSPSLPAQRNSLILEQICRAEGGEIEHEKYSCSVKPENYSGSAVIQHGCIYENQQVKSKEKGGTENTALWGYGFFHHEENQQHPVLDDSKARIRASEQNQHLAARQDLQLVKNYLQNPHMLNDNANLRNYKNQHIAEQYARTYEILVGHKVTVSKPVQPSGVSLAFLRCRRLISPCAAAIKNPAVLSPSSLTFSMDSKSSRGNLTDTCSDLLFLLPVAITESYTIRWCSVCTIIFLIQLLTWCSLVDTLVVFTLNVSWCIHGNAPQCSNTGRASNHNVTEAYTMALQHSTQTRPKFQYLFLAVCRSDLNAKPHREAVTANSEQDARRSLAGQFVLSFAGRIPAQGVCDA